MKQGKVVSELIKTGKYMMDKELAWGNAGNISARLDDDRYIITSSGTFLGDLNECDFTECSLSDASIVLPEGNKPSKEVPMHRAIYENRPEINAVLHSSPFHSTLFACSSEEIPSDWFVETMYYLERIERVGYYHPGSIELGEAVEKKAKLANIILLENHGVLVYDTSIKEARMALHTLEMACRMWVTAKNTGVNINTLSDATVKDFLDNSGYKPRRKWHV